MKYLDKFVAVRHHLKERYDKLLNNLPLIKPHQSLDSYSALHLYPIQINLNEIKRTRREVFKYLRENEIGVNIHYIPVHTQPYFQNIGFKRGDYSNAESYYESAISIPIFHGLTIQMQDEVIGVLKKALV
jgi:dTDP-4-amino-4,6-dideoxygalactose transaminase